MIFRHSADDGVMKSKTKPNANQSVIPSMPSGCSRSPPSSTVEEEEEEEDVALVVVVVVVVVVLLRLGATETPLKCRRCG